MKNIAVFTSGGDSPGMNPCLRAVYKAGVNFGFEVYGIMGGYEGIIDGDFVLLNEEKVWGISSRGGTILRSARSDRFRTKEGRAKAYQNLKKANIDAIIAIGGDGTFTGATVFMNEYPDIKMVGCPGTIDNDLVGTDFTIGYDTAINTVVEAVDKIRDTANSHNRLFFVEVMGRDAGLIALRAGISAEADAILVPELTGEPNQLIDLLRTKENKQTSYIVVVAEGDERGGAKAVAEKIKKELPQFDTKITILGHIQRGGSPTAMERFRAAWMGAEAVKALMENVHGVMIGIVDNKIKRTPFSKAIKHHNSINADMVDIMQLLSVVM